MPGKRSAGQTMIGCWCDAALVEKIDRARRHLTRSHFCREAIAEKLRSLGFDVPERETASPDRAGKGGPKRVLYPLSRRAAQLNDPASGSNPKRPPGSKTGPEQKPKPK